jgi:putative FmdB family regulatory protein
MPLYEYECDACGHRFEVIQKFSDAPIETCPVCGGAVHKLLSSPAIQFKGSGWYITDYARKDSSSTAGDKGAKSEGASAAKSDGNGAKSEKADTNATSGSSSPPASSDSSTPKT